MNMKVLVKKINEDLVSVKYEIPCADGNIVFDDDMVFSEFMKSLYNSVDVSLNVSDMKYEDGNLIVKRYDFFGDEFCTDNYIFDDGFVKDASFMKEINVLSFHFKNIKDVLNDFIQNCINDKKEREKIEAQARKIFREYCLSGNITLPDDRSNLRKIYEMFDECYMPIFFYYEADGDGIKQRYNTVDGSELGLSDTSDDNIMMVFRRKSKDIAALIKSSTEGFDNKVYTKTIIGSDIK